jgi:GntR family transcriptional regulator, N-acetylglucosamine utilization regulator
MSAGQNVSATLVDHLRDALEKEDRSPLYEQVAAAILEDIRSGLLAPGMMLPKEIELAAQLGVSRQTVNQAMTSLAHRGLLIRRRGIGTFVAAAEIEQPLNNLYSFIRSVTAQAHKPGNRMLGSRTTIEAPASMLLTGDSDGLLFEIGRLRLIDEEPFVVEYVYFSREVGKRVPLDRLERGELLYDLLRECAGITISRAEETLHAVVTRRIESTLLTVPAGSPAFLVERRGFVGAQMVEFRRSLIRGDRYQFRVELIGDSLDEPSGSHSSEAIGQISTPQ